MTVKRLAIIVVLLLVLIIGGGLTTQLIASGKSSPLPILTQSGNPDASVSAMYGWKAEQLFLAIGFIITSLIGFAVVLTAVFWFLDRGVRVSQAEAAASKAAVPAQQAKEGS